MNAPVSNPGNDLILNVMFPTFLGETWYPGFEAEKDKLLSRIRQFSVEDEEGIALSRSSYPNGYTSYFTHDRLFNDPVFAGLADFIRQQAAHYGLRQGWDMENHVPVMTSLWCNINGQHSHHADHVHPCSHISGVFYVSCTADSAVIRFKDPRPGRWMVPPPVARSAPENALVMEIAPRDGKILLFPSFIEHGVLPNPDRIERISMSFNLEIRPRGHYSPE